MKRSGRGRECGARKGCWRPPVAAGLSVLLSAAPVLAQDADGALTQAESAREFFRQADADGNGELTPEEYALVQPGYSFEEVVGQDGRLTLEDYARAYEENVFHSQASLDLLDLDGNGSVSPQEYEQSDMRPPFAEVDLTEDGGVDLAEQSIALARDSEEQEQPAPGGGEEDDRGQVEAMARIDPTQLTGKTVRLPHGEGIGEVRRVLEDGDSGRLVAVITPADDAGQEERFPIERLRLEEGELVLIEEPRQALREADVDPQALEPLDLPQTAPPIPEPRGDLERLAELEPGALVGEDLVDREGRALGEIERVLTGKQEGELFLLVKSSASPETGEQVVVPLDRVSRVDGRLRLEAGEVLSYEESAYLQVEELEVPLAASREEN